MKGWMDVWMYGRMAGQKQIVVCVDKQLIGRFFYAIYQNIVSSFDVCELYSIYCVGIYRLIDGWMDIV